MNRPKVLFVFVLLFVLPSPARAAEPATQVVTAARAASPSDDDSRHTPFFTRLRVRAIAPDLTRPDRAPSQSAAPVIAEDIHFDHRVLEVPSGDRHVPVAPRTAECLPYYATAPP